MTQKMTQKRMEIVRPDVAAYQGQKGILAIDNSSNTFPPAPFYSKEFDVRLLGHLRYIELASRLDDPYDGARYAGFFPGSVLPGPKRTEEYVGPLAFDRWKHAIQMIGRKFDINSIESAPGQTNPPEIEYDVIKQIQGLPEKHKIKKVSFERMEKGIKSIGRTSQEEITTVSRKVNRILKESIKKGHTEETLELLQILQNPYVREDTYAKGHIKIVEKLFERYNLTGSDSPLQVAMQIEAAVGYLHSTEDMPRVFAGNYNGVYVEVFSRPLEEIKATELFQPDRAAYEIKRLKKTHAFAPILIEEHGENTDGTHRQVAFMTYNTVQALGTEKPVIDNIMSLRGELPFLERNLELHCVMEALQFLQDKEPELLKELQDFASSHAKIEHVPVVVGMEPQACAVVKDPFDEGTDIIGLPSPFIYKALREGNGAVALGARGPYHRSDRSIMPWFDIGLK